MRGLLAGLALALAMPALPGTAAESVNLILNWTPTADHSPFYYAKSQGWTFELMELSEGEAGGARHAMAAIRGEGCWQALGYENGVHQVKRVPATETQGRIHTSACTVVVLPEPEEGSVEVPTSEVVEELYCASSGPGGQNVNKVATAVRLTHPPTGDKIPVIMIPVPPFRVIMRRVS